MDLPHVDARPKVSSPGSRAGLILHGSHEWDDDMAALGDLGASISPKGGASGRSVTFGASPKTPGGAGAGARRTQASQPRAHTVGASPRSRGARLSTGALPALSPRGSRSRGLDFGPSLRSREGGFDDVDLGGSMRVSSLSHSFDAGGVGGVVNHFPDPGHRSRRSRRSSGPGSPSESLSASPTSGSLRVAHRAPGPFPTGTKKAPQPAARLTRGGSRRSRRPGRTPASGTRTTATASMRVSTRDSTTTTRACPTRRVTPSWACPTRPWTGSSGGTRRLRWWFRAVRRTTTRWW